jgi:DNA-binding NarL/FixJ family response regulator
MSHLERCVLIVDDEFLIAEGLRMQVEDMALPVCAVAGTADDAIAEAQLHRPLIVLMDVRLKGEKDGVDAALAIHRILGSKIIFITGSSDPATMERISTDHPLAILRKPVAERQLKAAIDIALGQAMA